MNKKDSTLIQTLIDYFNKEITFIHRNFVLGEIDYNFAYHSIMHIHNTLIVLPKCKETQKIISKCLETINEFHTYRNNLTSEEEKLRNKFAIKINELIVSD